MRHLCLSVFICGFIFFTTISAKDLRTPIPTPEILSGEATIDYRRDMTLNQLTQQALAEALQTAVGKAGQDVSLLKLIVKTMTVANGVSEGHSGLAASLDAEGFYNIKWDRSKVRYQVHTSEKTGLPTELTCMIPEVKLVRQPGRRPSLNLDFRISRKDPKTKKLIPASMFQHDETIFMEVKTNEPCHLVLLSFDEDDLTVMLPNKKWPSDRKLKPGKWKKLWPPFGLTCDPGEQITNRYFYAIGLLEDTKPPRGVLKEDKGYGILQYHDGFPLLLNWLGSIHDRGLWASTRIIANIRRKGETPSLHFREESITGDER